MDSGELRWTPVESSDTGGEGKVLPIKTIMCSRCGERAFYSLSFDCSFCSSTTYSNSYGHNVRITAKKSLKEIVEEVFGEEINELSMSVA